MEAAYIKNKGVTQTTIQDNHHHTKTNEIKWDADYNGKYANIKLDVADNGKKNKYRIKLDNKDLANMLNVSSVNRPIDQRLEMDFLKGHMEPEMQVDLQQIHTPKSFILPQLKPELEPEPILYRVNIPQKKNTMSLENQLLDIDRELSELSSIMVDGNTGAETYGNLTPKHPKIFGATHSLKRGKLRRHSRRSLTQKVVNPISRKRNKTKNMLYKTPLPKTVRIHYKTPRQNRKKNQKNQKKKTRKYKKREPKPIQNQNQQLVSNFFRNLSK